MTLTTIAIAYRASTAATTICALEAQGIDVFCPGFHIANTLPHYALGIGGIGIAVPEDQQKDALTLLHSYANSRIASDTRSLKVLNVLGWLAFGVSSPWPDLLLKDMPRQWLDADAVNR